MGSSRNMAMSFGNIGEYHEGCEECKQYAECLDHFLAVNGITNAADREQFFSQSLDRKPTNCLPITTDHQCPPPSEIVQRFKFHTRV